MDFITIYAILMILIAIVLTVLLSKGYNRNSEQKIAVIIGVLLLAASVVYCILNYVITGEFKYVIAYIVVGLIAAAMVHYRTQKSMN